jgi:hypothetical protein
MRAPRDADPVTSRRTTLSKAFLICALVSALPGLAGARQPAITADMPSEAVRLHGALLPKVQPPVRSWIDQEARKLALAGPHSALDAAAVRAQVRSRFAGQRLGSMDIDALVVMVMMEAAATEEQMLKDQLEQMKKVNAAREKLRALQGEARKQMEQNAGRKSTERCVAPLCGGLQVAARDTAVAMREARVAFNPPERIDDIGQLRAINDDLKGKLDSMNEMSEMSSLRLQMMMDRRSKFISTLSNIMKKISTTQDTLVQNLK